MRSKDRGMISSLPKTFTQNETWEMFSKMCLIRHFELNAKRAYDQGLMPKTTPIYLAVGHEAISSALSVVFKNKKPALFSHISIK